MAYWNKEEQLSLQKLLNETDDQTKEWVQKMTKEMMTFMVYYKCALMEIETKFNVLNEEFSMEYDRNPISSIKTRLKDFRSIKEKMVRLQKPFSIQEIEKNLNDIAGVRVICSFCEDVYALSDALLKQDDITLIEKKDYIAHPKENGYRSLHLIVAIPIFLSNEKQLVKVEIQLRTIAMDFWASLEHQLRYKKDHPFTEEMTNELLSCAQLSAELDQRMEALRKKIEPRNQLEETIYEL